MRNLSRSFLLLGVATLSLVACAGDKGPGEIGSKDDIVVVNKGIPGSQAIAPAAEGEDFTTIIEQAEAVPAAQVSPAEPLVEQQSDDASQVTSTTDSTTTQENPAVEPAPQAAEDVSSQIAPAPVVSPAVAPLADPVQNPEPTASVAAPTTPSESVPAATSEPVPATPAAPTAVQSQTTPYPLDTNAPYSPKAMAAAAAAAGTVPVEPVVSSSGLNMADPAIIRSTQAALAAKKLYVGPQTGMMDAELLNVVTKYQADNKLPVSGGLNEETLKHLGIIE